MKNPKPHLAYDAQLDRMVERGLTYSDRTVALSALKQIGYYRLSAYTYPFRLEVEPENPEDARVRSERFKPGSTFEDALALYEFDAKLRSVLLEGLNTIEVGFAVKLGYVLGKRSALAHLDPSCLDQGACEQRIYTETGEQTRFEQWCARYEKLKHEAREEEYVKHHILHYDGNIPIWVATEFLDFGSLLRLYRLAKPSDARKISSQMGIENDASALLARWLKALNILRNHCAHSNRVWNRSTVDVPPKFSIQVVDSRLHHLNDLDSAMRLKLYYLSALIAYLITQIAPRSNWPRTFKTVARKLGNVGGMTVESVMGFPNGWDSLPLWNYDPSSP